MLPLGDRRGRRLRVRCRRRRARLPRKGRRQALHRGLGERRIRSHVQGAEPALAGRDHGQRLRRRLPRSRGNRDACARSTRTPPATPRSSDGTTVVPVTIKAGTVAFGEFEADVDLPYDEGGIAWDPSLVFPGLERGEHLESEIELAPRAPILAADGTPLAEGDADAREHPLGSAAIDVTGEVGIAEEEDLPALARQGFSAETPVGISGLERAFNARLAGRPGGIAARGPRRGRLGPRDRHRQAQARRAGEDDDRPRPAVLRGRRPGRALGRDRGARRPQRRRPGARRPGLLRPPATWLHLQDGHHHRRAGGGRRLARRRIRNHQRRHRRPLHRKRQRRVLRRHLPPGLRRVLQRGLRAAGAEDRQRQDGRNGRTLRLQLPADPLRAPDRARSRAFPNRASRPRSAKKPTSASPRSARAKCWRRRSRWRASRRRSATSGVRMPTSIVTNKKLRPHAKPVRVMSKKIAGELTELMIGVVTEGHRLRGGDPGGPGRGQDRNGRARPQARPGERRTSRADQGRLVRGLRARPKAPSWRSGCC